jgi:predicted Zn-dependent protease
VRAASEGRLWGGRGLIREGDDDELAFVLAHEIAHVNLLHASLRQTQAAFNERMQKDAFFAASLTSPAAPGLDAATVACRRMRSSPPR